MAGKEPIETKVTFTIVRKDRVGGFIPLSADISAVATESNVFEMTPALGGLTAVFAMVANSFLQLRLGFLNASFAAILRRSANASEHQECSECQNAEAAKRMHKSGNPPSPR